MQVIELWEDTQAARALPPAEHHVVRVLYNHREVHLGGASRDEPLTLAAFGERVLSRFEVSPADFAARCEPAGDAAQPMVDASSI
jgi:hypothetical protein